MQGPCLVFAHNFFGFLHGFSWFLHFFPFAQALSTRLGYGLPALLARALAAAFWDGVNGVDFLLGFFVSQNAFFFIVSPLGILSYAVHYVRSTLHYRVSLVLGLLNGCR